MTLNQEVIKIFIESRLVSCHSFYLFNDHVEKREGDSKILFELRNSKLELRNMQNDRVLISIEIPENIGSKECISFAHETLLLIYQVIESNVLFLD